MSIDLDQPNNGKPDINQLYMNPEPPAYINPPKTYDFPSPPNQPPRFADPTAYINPPKTYDFPSPPNQPPHFADPTAYVRTPKDKFEGLISKLPSEYLQVVLGLLDYPTGPINPASGQYDELMEIKKQIPLLSEEDKQYFKTSIQDRITSRLGGRRKRTRRSKSRRRRNSRRKSRRR